MTQSVHFDPVAILGVGLVLVSQGDASVGTTQLCKMRGGEGRGGEGRGGEGRGGEILFISDQ